MCFYFASVLQEKNFIDIVWPAICSMLITNYYGSISVISPGCVTCLDKTAASLTMRGVWRVRFVISECDERFRVRHQPLFKGPATVLWPNALRR